MNYSILTEKEFSFIKIIFAFLVVTIFQCNSAATPQSSPPSLSGKVQDIETGRPILNAHVAITELGLIRTTNEAGFFSFEGIISGNYTVIVTHVGFETGSLPVEIREGLPAYLPVKLSKVVINSPEVTYSEIKTNRGDHTIINSKAISESAWNDVGDAIETSSGVQIFKQGGIGGKKTVSLRGCRPDHVIVMVDDAALNDGNGDAVDLGLLQLQNVNRIEIVKGISIDGGFGGFGGIIKIYTNDFNPNFPFSSRVTGQVQSYSGKQISASIEGGNSSTRMRFSGQVISSDGNFIYTDEFDKSKSRINNQAEILNTSANIERNIGNKWKSNTTIAYNVAHRGSPSPLFQPPTPEARNDESSLRINFIARRKFTIADLQIQSFFHKKNRHFINPRIQTDPTTGITTMHAPVNILDGDTRTGIIAVYENLVFSFRKFYLTNGLSGGVNLESYFSSNELDIVGASDPIEEKIYRTAAWVMGHSELRQNVNSFEGTLKGSIRVDGLNDSQTGITSPLDKKYFPEVSSKVRVAVSPQYPEEYLGWNLYAGIGNTFSPPSFISSFLVESIFSLGNPDLKPERANEITAGCDINIRSKSYLVTTGFSVWQRYTRDLIIWRRNFRGQYQPVNLGRASTEGLDVSMQTTLFAETITLGGTLTIQRALNDDPDSPYFRNRIPFQPDWYGSVQSRVFLGKYNTGFESRFSGQRFSSESNLDLHSNASGNLSPFNVWNGWVSRKFQPQNWELNVTGSIENIFNTEYQLLANMPMPGRIWKISLEIKK
ncbi:MAG: TonB-dependent receptor [Candidatus Electryonea clarkiae]|nr:TonB-dependent receptor [Candidatus Electryonea clarkiae]MDP8286079.1 TonB-dependent receptor [Candidatus Electryonea clarkiae]